MRITERYNEALLQLRGIYDESEAKTILKRTFEHFGITVPGREIKEKIIDANTDTKLADAVQRLLAHEPLQYILGNTFFFGLEFHVNSSVLIPRPETEELVEIALNFLKTRATATIIDIGTGSGCIAIAIKKKFSNAKVTGIDISDDALAVARKNVALHHCEIDFKKLDVLTTELAPMQEGFDVIISNPPYIPVSEKSLMSKNVTDFEPAIALFVPDEKPLIFYEKIAQFAKQSLSRKGMIFLEIHEHFGKEVQEMFLNAGYAAQLKKDMSGKARFVLASHRH